MALETERIDRSERLVAERTVRRHPSRLEYYSELRAWVQHTILEAERNRDTKKISKFLNLLEDL